MTIQSLLVKQNWAKAGNAYVGDQPEGATSGGDAALGWSAPSGIAQGSSVSLLTDGTNPFGTGPTNVRYEDYEQAGAGVEVTAANTNFDSNNNFVKAIRDSDARSGAVSASTWQEHSTVNDWRSADVYIDFTACTELFISYAVKVPSGSNFPSGGNTGTDADYSTNSSWKTSWILGPNTATNDLVTPTHTGNGVWSHSGNDLSGLRSWGSNPTWWEWGAWNRLTTWVKAGATPQTDAGDLYFQVANTVDTIFEDSTTPVVFGSGTAPYEWSRWQPQGWQSTSSTQGGVKTLYDCIYIATGTNAAARVELGDNAVYSSCTDLHIQHVTPANWATGQIDWTLDLGPFSASNSLWLHITREDNSTRYSIQVS